MADPATSGGDITTSSPNWGFVKITIATPAVAQSPASQGCKECLMYKLSGTGAFVAPTAADANSIPLPETLAEAWSIPIENLNQLSFFGTAGDVIMIIWRG